MPIKQITVGVAAASAAIAMAVAVFNVFQRLSFTTIAALQPAELPGKDSICYRYGQELFMNTTTAIAIAVLTALTPTVTCLIGIILSRSDLRDFRIEFNSKLDKVDARFVQLETKVDARFVQFEAKVDARFLQLETKVDAKLNKISADLNQFYALNSKLEGRVDEISKR